MNPTNTSVVLGISLLYFSLSFLGILHHEIWLDEAHHWLLARDSGSLIELYRNTRYEGHPLSWNLILYGLTRFTSNPFWMQLLHILISTATIFIFLKKAPFKIWMKVLFVFGYFTLFEYNLLSRNYALGMFLLVLATSYFPNRHKKIVTIALILAALCNTHAIFCIPAGCYMAILLLEKPLVSSKQQLFTAAAIFGVGAVLAAIQILPPNDTQYFKSIGPIDTTTRIARGITPFFKSVFVFPDVTSMQFWNTHAVFTYNKMFGFVLACLSLGLSYLLFGKSRLLTLYMYAGIVGCFLFVYFTQLTATRYSGILYFMLISALWMQYSLPEVAKKRFLFFSESTYTKGRAIIIYTVLTLQFCSGVFAYGMDLAKPFTNAKQTLLYLEQEDLLDKWVTTNACDGTPVSAYLEKKLFYIRFNALQSFCIWNRLSPLNGKIQDSLSIIASLEQQLKTQQESIIFISYRPVFKISEENKWHPLNNNLRYRVLKKFEHSIVPKGTYYIYEIDQ